MAVSKRLRFEVLRRDNHTCKYCGRSAPEVRLTVDHVVPETLGGSDRPENLVAACSDCNSGKSATPPDASQVAQVEDDAVRWATAIRSAADDMLADQLRVSRLHDEFRSHWDNWQVPEWALPADWRSSVDSFIGAGLPMGVLLTCLDRAMERRTVGTKDVFRYMAGIAWRKVAELQESARVKVQPSNSDDEEERIWESMQPGRADMACQILAELDYAEIAAWIESARSTFDEEDQPAEHEVQIEAAHLAFRAYRARLRIAERALYELVHSFPIAQTRDLVTEARAFFSGVGDDEPSTLSVLAWVARAIAERKSESH